MKKTNLKYEKLALVTDGSNEIGLTSWLGDSILRLSGLAVLADLGKIRSNSLEAQLMNELTLRS